MSEILDDITLTLNTTSTISPQGFSFDLVEWVVFVNASPFALRVLVGSNGIPVPAWSYYPYHVGHGNLKNSISVLPYLQTIPGSGFTKTLSTVLYDQYEKPDSPIPHGLGGGPVDLTIASSVSNTGNPAGNVFIFAEPINDSSVIGAVNLTNIGQLILGDLTYAGSIDLKGPSNSGRIQLNNGTTPNVIMSNNSAGQEIIFQVGLSPAIDLSGSLSAKAILIGNSKSIQSKDTGGTTRDLIFIDGSNQVKIGAAGANSIIFQDNGGVALVQIDGTGLVLKSGTLSFLTGSVARVSKFAGTATTTPTFFNHLLGATPDVVLLQLNGSSATVHDLWNDYASMTSTQTKITADGTNGFVGYAIKS